MAEPSNSIVSDYVERLATVYGSFEGGDAPTIAAKSHSIKSDNDDSAEFRLFANLGPSASESQRVVLRSPTPDAGNPGFVVTRRPDTYYFMGEATEEQVQQYQQASVSGYDILASLATRWKGCEVPWRVTVIKRPSPAKSSKMETSETRNSEKRARKGKKTRIAIRKRIVKANAIQAEKAVSQEQKEANEREKRNRRNREKKIKRRQKQRDTKASQRGTD